MFSVAEIHIGLSVLTECRCLLHKYEETQWSATSHYKWLDDIRNNLTLLLITSALKPTCVMFSMQFHCRNELNEIKHFKVNNLFIKIIIKSNMHCIHHW